MRLPLIPPSELSEDQKALQLICRTATYESQSKDYQFSRSTMEEHWQAGCRNAHTAFSDPQVLALPAHASDVQVFDCLRPPANTAAG